MAWRVLIYSWSVLFWSKALVAWFFNLQIFWYFLQMMEANEGWLELGRPSAVSGRWIHRVWSAMVLGRGRLLPILFPLRKNGRQRQRLMLHPVLIAIVLLCSIQGKFHTKIKKKSKLTKNWVLYRFKFRAECFGLWISYSRCSIDSYWVH